MITYEDYLKANHDSLTFEESNEIYTQIIESSNTNDQDFKELWVDVIDSAINYVNFRARWSIQTWDERRNVGGSRSIEHNSFMRNLQIIARYMENQGWGSEWFDKLGTIEKDRKRLGDFACYLLYINSLNAR